MQKSTSNSVKAEDRAYWQEQMEKHPLFRYRTPYSASDVVTLIQSTDPEGVEVSPNIYFDRLPTPLEEEGVRYNFYIEYRSWVYPLSNDPETKKVGHIEGAVISGLTETILEFRSSHSTQNKIIVWFMAWLILVLGPVSACSWAVTSWTEDERIKTIIFVLTVFILIIALWYLWPAVDDTIVGQGMKTVVKKLNATRINGVGKHKTSLRSKINRVIRSLFSAK